MKLPIIKPKELIKVLEKRGCILRDKPAVTGFFIILKGKELSLSQSMQKNLKGDYFVQLLKN